MALAETKLESPQNTGPLGRDDFVKRRQAQRSAAGDSRTDSPGDGDEITPLADALAAPAEETTEVVESTIETVPEAIDDLSFFDDDEINSGDEPTTLSVLNPPASMSEAERQAFVDLPDDIKQYVARVHETTAKAARQTGETMAARNKEIDDRVAELDQSLAQARAVLEQPIDDIPFTPPHSQAALTKLLDDHGSEAWIKAKEENEAARDSHQSLLREAKADREKQKSDIKKQIEERQKQLIAKRDEQLPVLIPTWKDPETRKKEADQLQAYLSADFSPAELAQIATHAPLIAKLRKAMRYDAALEKRRQAQAKGKNGSATARAAPAQGRRSASNTNSDLEAAEKRYKNSPSADNFARLRKLKRAAAEASTTRRRV